MKQHKTLQYKTELVRKIFPNSASGEYGEICAFLFAGYS